MRLRLRVAYLLIVGCALPAWTAPAPPGPTRAASESLKKRGLSKVRLRGEYLALRQQAAPGVARAQRRLEAVALRRRQAASRTNVLAMGTTWSPIGPAPITLGQTDTNGGARANVSGRFTAIAFSGSTVYAGAAQGGLWSTANNGASWTPLGDSDFATLAIGSIAVDPGNTSTIYVGTGEGNGSLDSYGGVGVYKSVDGGASWTGPLPTSSNPFTGFGIGSIAVDRTNSSVVLACTHVSQGGIGAATPPVPVGGQPGVWRSSDAGQTWTNVLAGGFNCSNIVQGPTNAHAQWWYAAMDQIGLPAGSNTFNGGLLLSTDGGVSWRQLAGNPSPLPTWTVTQPLPPNSGISGQEWGRAWVTVSATGLGASESTVYVGNAILNDANAAGPPPNPLGAAGDPPGRIFKSTDSGENWVEQTSAKGYCDAQCFYDLPIYAVPTAPDTLVAGGAATNTSSAGRPASLRVSANGGGSWTDRNTGLHADMHFIAAEPGSTTNLWLANDGGIWRSTSTGSSWTNVNTNLSATQFVAFDLHPTNASVAYGGTQDNGTESWSGSDAWFHADDGDGGFAMINKVDPTKVAHTYFNVSGSQIGVAAGFLGTTTPPGSYTLVGAFCTNANCSSTQSNGINLNDRVLFYAPVIADPGSGAAASTLYFGTNKLYKATSYWNTVQTTPLAPNIFVDISGGTDFGSPTGMISSIAAVPNGTNEAQVLFVGSTNGSIYRSTNGGTSWGSTSAGSLYISDIAIDPTTIGNVNTMVVYAAESGFESVAGRNVLKSTDGGVTFQYSGTGLPNVPVNALLVDPVDHNRVWAGHDVGVSLSLDGGATWNDYSAGMPNVAVWDLKAAPGGSGDQIVAATHGRGMYRLTPLTPATLTSFAAE